MKINAYFILLLFSLLTQVGLSQSVLPPPAVIAIPADSIQVRSAATAPASADDNDFNPGLGLFALFAITAILFCIGVGVVIGMVTVALMTGLLAAGLLSGSLLVGYYRKSATAGFRFLLFSGLSLTGVLSCAFFVWFLNRGLHWFSPNYALVIGGIGGLLTGIIIAFSITYLLQQLVRRFDAK